MNFISLFQVFLPVKDVRKSAQWYSQHFNVMSNWKERSSIQGVIELSFKEFSIYLVESPALNIYTHIPFNFHTNNLEKFHESLSKSGVVVTEITTHGECFDFNDPDGNRIGMCLDHFEEPDHIDVIVN